MYQWTAQHAPPPPSDLLHLNQALGFKDALEFGTGLIDTYMDTNSGMIDT
jgi:hypothetical protein